MGTSKVVLAVVFALTLGTVVVASPASADLNTCKRDVANAYAQAKEDCEKNYPLFPYCVNIRPNDKHCKQNQRIYRQKCLNPVNEAHIKALASCHSSYGK